MVQFVQPTRREMGERGCSHSAIESESEHTGMTAQRCRKRHDLAAVILCLLTRVGVGVPLQRDWGHAGRRPGIRELANAAIRQSCRM